MGVFTWLFGKKENAVAATVQAKREPIPVSSTPPAEKPKPKLAAPENRKPAPPSKPQTHQVAKPEIHPAIPSEAENLKHWRESGQARAWVEAHHGRWEHSDWLNLLEELRCSAFWPMQPDAIGMVLEELKQQWLQRN
jgi:hypothetical protein